MEQFIAVRRRIITLLNTVYWRLPWRWRDPLVDFGYLVAGPLFKGVGHYETWKRKRLGQHFHPNFSWSDTHAALVDLKQSTLCAESIGSIAVHAHVFYPDLAQEFADYFDNMPFAYDLFVSVPDTNAEQICVKHFSGLKQCANLKVAVVPNRGRDIAPFFVTFGGELQSYDFIAHVHTKKSLYNRGKTDGWREYLLGGLFGGEKRVRQIFGLFESDKQLGLVYPQNCAQVPYYANAWLANRGSAQVWCSRLGIEEIPEGYFHFPVGSMFWARTDALRPLLEAGIRIEDFPEESGQTDGTLAHCLERMLGVVPVKSGYRLAIVRDLQFPSWSPWRFDQYISRTREQVTEMIESPAIRVVIFDIFDTLLVRPVLDPESTKTIVAHRAGNQLGPVYLLWRAQAEVQARQKAGRDVGLGSIYEEFSRLSKLEKQAVDYLRGLEESVEGNAVTPRLDVVALFHHAVAAGKRVLLASDMYLSREHIETVLARCGIAAWHKFYLSSDVGRRKDSGELYRYILSEENALPENVLMVGDNERSDLQIPAEMGLANLHLLRPVELARGMPRIGSLVDAALQRGDMHEQLATGMLVQRAFQPLFYPSSAPTSLVPASPISVGYTIAGPLLVAFSYWLAAKANEDGVKRLYFLSREGKLLKDVYDRCVAGLPAAPPSDYLVLSRRAIAVPMVRNMDDIRAIAHKVFFMNRIEAFLYYRYGLVLSASVWAEIEERRLWKKDKLLAIQDSQIEHIEALLEFLAPLIYKQAEDERPALMRYLTQMGLMEDGKNAVVDVGYSGTIQRSLNSLLEKEVHGYYMLTDEKISAVVNQYEVIAQGAYFHAVPLGDERPSLLRQSFLLEKLLSSDDPQVMRYGTNGCDSIAEFGELSDEEKQSRGLRAEIQRGVYEYISDALNIRNNLYPGFTPSLEHAASLFSAFADNMNADEKLILNRLVLDDHYCGRGVN
jgi:predicted HAD superfamily hydrolase